MTVVPRTRQALLKRGWYVASEVELAFMGLSGRAHDLLIILKHIQGGNDDACPTRERLAEMMTVSVRTVQTLLNELKRKGAIGVRRTGRNNRYDVKYMHASPTELRLLLGAEVQIPSDLQAPDVQESCTSEVQDPRSPLLYKEPLTKNHNYPSLREGDAAASQRVEESQMRGKPEPADEFDPVAALWPQEAAQELPDSPEGIFPAQEVQEPVAGRRRPVRSRAQLDSPMALAGELASALRNANWDAGPSPVNMGALARNISAWKRDGVTADQIRAMIARFVSDAGMRTAAKTPWIDFVGKRHKLLALESRAAVTATVEEHRYSDESYWLGAA